MKNIYKIIAGIALLAYLLVYFIFPEFGYVHLLLAASLIFLIVGRYMKKK